ncbi:MAG: hypothetical protein JWM68_2339 [Verrucomicrobiales bacterium]|nr:hypothetical protein [Verrucomicrobiales bacterium]
MLLFLLSRRTQGWGGERCPAVLPVGDCESYIHSVENIEGIRAFLCNS